MAAYGPGRPVDAVVLCGEVYVSWLNVQEPIIYKAYYEGIWDRTQDIRFPKFPDQRSILPAQRLAPHVCQGLHMEAVGGRGLLRLTEVRLRYAYIRGIGMLNCTVVEDKNQPVDQPLTAKPQYAKQDLASVLFLQFVDAHVFHEAGTAD
jgi:hypothetical protein